MPKLENFPLAKMCRIVALHDGFIVRQEPVYEPKVLCSEDAFRTTLLRFSQWFKAGKGK